MTNPAERRVENIDAIHLTDVGNSRRLARRWGDVIRYVPQFRAWHVWDGTRWARDVRGVIYELAKETALAIADEAKSAETEEQAKALLKWAANSQSRARIEAMVALARTEPTLAITPDALDRDKFALNVRNGTIDLRTGELRPHDPADYLTKLAPVEYDPDATCPTFDAFLRRIMDERDDLIDFLPRAVGYTLTGNVSERVIFLMYGTGRNGKSTFLNVLREVFGDYHARASMDTITHRKRDGSNYGVARLAGARLVTASESEEGKRLNVALVKELTGNEQTTAREIYEAEFEFLPEFTWWIATNHKPVVPGDDPAVWDRLRLVPFLVRIGDDEEDKDLGVKLQSELPGILASAVRGAREWYERGLGVPEEVTSATAEYRDEQDSFGAWLDEETVRVPEVRTSSAGLYASYAAWSSERGEKPVGTKRFAQRLVERGFERIRSSSTFYLGIGLREHLGTSEQEMQELPHRASREEEFPQDVPTSAQVPVTERPIRLPKGWE